MYKRILVLGPTGVNKREACTRLAGSKEGVKLGYRVVDFDKEYIGTVTRMPEFLNSEIKAVHLTWRSQWQEFMNLLGNEPTLLCLHSCYVTSDHGTRSAIDLEKICTEYKPDLIVTLIDDVYNMGARVIQRTEDGDRLLPSLEQLLLARRTEALIGDLVRARMSADREDVRHVFLSVNHPILTLENIVFHRARVQYLSFPISQPRKDEKRNDFELTETINEAHQRSTAEMQRNRNVSFISPLTIDELPFLPENSGIPITQALNEEKSEKVVYRYNPSEHRWSLANLWKGEPLLSDSIDAHLEFDAKQVEIIDGTVRTDVGWRDRRLALQADALTVICPKPKNKSSIARGVHDEIQAVAPRGINVNIWQEPAWDPQNLVYSAYGDPGSMGQIASNQVVRYFDTLKNLIASGG